MPDEIANIIIENNQLPYDNILNLIIQKINKNKHGDFSSILTKMFTIDQEPRDFINQKFLVFNQMNIPNCDRVTWLKYAIPASLEPTLNKEQLIDSLVRYKIDKKDSLDHLNKLQSSIDELKNQIQRNVQINYINRPSNRAHPYNRPSKVYSDCKYCRYLKRYEENSFRRRHKHADCWYKEEAIRSGFNDNSTNRSTNYPTNHSANYPINNPATNPSIPINYSNQSNRTNQTNSDNLIPRLNLLPVLANEQFANPTNEPDLYII